MASIYQIFSSETTPKSVVILENQLIDTMTSDNLIETEMEPIDNLALISFVGKFNKKYGNTLSEEQKNLLNLYISSFADNSLSLKSFLNEEIGRLKDSVNQSLELTEITEDSEMLEKASRVVKMLEGFSTSRVSDELLVTILKTQELVKELSVNVDNN